MRTRLAITPFTVAATVAATLAAGGTACSRPAPPTLVPDRVSITGMSLTTIDLDVTLSVTNPNSIDLVARNLTAHVVIGGKYDVGTVDIPVTTVLAAEKATKLDVPLTVKVTDIAPLAKLAMSSAAIPYTVDGTVGLGGDLLHVDLPYRLSDSVPRDQIVRATLGSLPMLR
jgi:LEA14-like dessication related protein